MKRIIAIAACLCLAVSATAAPSWMLDWSTAAGGWTPADLGAALYIWHDASDADTLWQDIAGTVPATEGTMVAVWTDKSQYANLSTSWGGTDYLGPTLTSEMLVFPYTTTNYIRIASGTETNLMATNRTMFAVYYTTNGSLSAAFFGFGDGANPSLRYGYVTDGVRIGDYWNGGYAIPAYTVAPAVLSVMTHQYEPGVTVTHWKDGTQVSTGTRAGTWQPMNQSRIGNNRAGAVAEFFIADTQDTAGRQKAEGYLAWKWGLEGSLDAGHPYKSAAP